MPPQIGDILNPLRFRNIFNSPEPLPVDFGVPAPDFSIQPEDESNMVNRRLMELYNPSMEIQNRLGELIGSMPEREEPSRMRKIFAAFAGMGAEDPLGAAEKFAYAPYLREMEDWQSQFEPISKAADLERLGNVNQRILAEQTIQRELEQRRGIETERRNKEQEELNRKKVELQERRDALAAFKATNPNYQLKTGQDGFIYAINPQNPTEIVNTRVKSNELSDLEKIRFQLDANIELARVRGDEARATKTTPPPPRPPIAPKDMSEIEKARARFNRAQEAKIEHPEWSPFIGLGPNNTVYVTPPGRNGPSAAMYNEIRAYLSGSTTSAAPVKSGESMVDMIAPDGRELSVPENKVEELIKLGAKRK